MVSVPFPFRFCVSVIRFFNGDDKKMKHIIKEQVLMEMSAIFYMGKMGRRMKSEGREVDNSFIFKLIFFFSRPNCAASSSVLFACFSGLRSGT